MPRFESSAQLKALCVLRHVLAAKLLHVVKWFSPFAGASTFPTRPSGMLNKVSLVLLARREAGLGEAGEAFAVLVSRMLRLFGDLRTLPWHVDSVRFVNCNRVFGTSSERKSFNMPQMTHEFRRAGRC